MKILVTGGAGYVGTRLSNYLYRQGHDVRVLDAFIYGNQGLYNDIDIIVGNVFNPITCNLACTGIDVVYHLAAISNDPTGDLDPKLTFDINYGGTQNMLVAAKKAKVKRFIFASSSSVLGIQDGKNIDEQTLPNPITPYGESKLKAENLVRYYANKDFVTVAIRPALICGPSPRQRFDLVVNTFTGNAFFDGKITVFGGGQRRPNTTMSDMIHLYNHLLYVHEDVIRGEVFNAGWENKTVLQMAQLIQKEVETRFNRTPEIEIKPIVDFRDYHITSSKIEKALNWHPSYCLVDMIRELAQSMKLGYITDYKKDIYYNIKVLTKKNK